MNLSLPGKPSSKTQIFPPKVPVKIYSFLRSICNPLILAFDEVDTVLNSIGGFELIE